MLGSQDRVALWSERLRRYERSKCTVAQFCLREEVSVASFYQWRRRLSELSTALRAEPAVPLKHREAAAFQRVLLTDGGVVVIELPNGVRVELPAQQTALVQSVVAALLHGEAGRRAENA